MGAAMANRDRDPLGSLAAVALAALALSVSVPVMRPIRGDGGDPPAAVGRRADQDALRDFAPLVGGWRGVGQVERGRTRGAWTEAATWAWLLTRDSAALRVEVARGKYLKAGVLRPGNAPGTLAFEATLADGTTRAFHGGPAAAGKPLALVADAGSPAEGLRRITLTPLHETRLLVLLESEDPGRHAFERLGEVGYTREGVAFAAGESGPVCVVTGGRGTTQVTHDGKTYWVCCSGCRDLFRENPEAVLAEAEARSKAEAKK